MTARVQIVCEDRQGWRVVHLHGVLDLQTVDEVRARLGGVVAEGCRAMVVDLSAVGFCDSLGFGALVAARRQMASKGGEMRLVLPAEGTVARTALHACGIRRVFDVFADVGTALAPTEVALVADEG